MPQQQHTALMSTLLQSQGDRLSGKCLFFVRVNPKGVSEKTLESDVAVGEIQGTALDTFKALLADLFLPLLQEQGSWGKMPPQHTKDFLTGAQNLSGAVLQYDTALYLALHPAQEVAAASLP